MMQQDGLLGKADHRAQRRFRSALGAYFATGTWATRETALYLEGERLAKGLEVEAEWERIRHGSLPRLLFGLILAGLELIVLLLLFVNLPVVGVLLL